MGPSRSLLILGACLLGCLNPGLAQTIGETEGPNTATLGDTKIPLMGGTGTAFVVREDGYLITNAHVVQSKDVYFEDATVQVELNGKVYGASVVKVDTERDLAILKIDAKGLHPIPFSDSNSVKLGQDVRAFGFPLAWALGQTLKVTRGTISGIETRPTGLKDFHTDTAINPGNSGGPLVNDSGQVIGVVYAKLKEQIGSNVGFAIPANDARKMLKALGVDLQLSKPGDKVDGVTISKRVAQSVAFVRVQPHRWRFDKLVNQQGGSMLIKSIALSRRGRVLSVVPADDQQHYVWVHSKRLPVRQDKSGPIGIAKFSPDGRYLVWTAGLGKGVSKVMLLGSNSGADPNHGLAFKSHNGYVACAAFSGDGKVFATGGSDKTVRIWNAAKFESSLAPLTNELEDKSDDLRVTSFGFQETPALIALSPTGQLVAVHLPQGKRIAIWDVQQRREKHSLATSESVYSLLFSPDGRRLLTAGGGATKFWNTETGAAAKSLASHASQISELFDGGRKLVALSGSEIKFFAFDRDDREMIGSLVAERDYQSPVFPFGMAASDDGAMLATYHKDGTLRMWDLNHYFSESLSNWELNVRATKVVSKHQGKVKHHFSQVLERIDLTDSESVVDADLKLLGSLSALESLKLAGTQVTDFGVKQLANLGALKELDLSRTKVTGSCLSDIRGLSELVTLKLDGTNIDDDALRNIEGFPRLRGVHLSASTLTDRGLEHLRKKPTLSILYLSGTKITDTGMADLKWIRNLGYLDLSHTEVTDKGIALLKDITDLKRVDVRGTRVTSEGVAELQKAFPDCKIQWEKK